MCRSQLPDTVLVVGLRRDGDVLVRRSNTILHHGELMLLAGHPADLHFAVAWLNPVSACGTALAGMRRCSHANWTVHETGTADYWPSLCLVIPQAVTTW